MVDKLNKSFRISELRYTDWNAPEAMEDISYIDRAKVLEYVQRLKDSEPPPISVVMLPSGLFVDDGNHRVNAAKLAGRTHIVGVHSPLSLSDRSKSMNVHLSRKKERAVPPSTVTLEEILRQKGPIHITAIIPIAEGEGMNLTGRNGTTAPYKTIRDKLNGSKRFHNFGSNVWGLPSQTLREV